jgi:biotin carboxylase
MARRDFWDHTTVRIVLSDGSGLTSRQCAILLDRLGHDVHVLAPPGLTLTRTTRHVAAVHGVPAYGPDPLAWWAAALEVLARIRADVLLPTQEQVAVISRHVTDLKGTRTVVPPFEALVRVQDKLSAHETLRSVGLRRPRCWVARSVGDLVDVVDPAFVKAPIGTASTAVRRVAGRTGAVDAARAFEAAGAFADGGVLVEEPVPGPLVMVQSVFANGTLVALHVNERTREAPAAERATIPPATCRAWPRMYGDWEPISHGTARCPSTRSSPPTVQCG